MGSCSENLFHCPAQDQVYQQFRGIFADFAKDSRNRSLGFAFLGTHKAIVSVFGRWTGIQPCVSDVQQQVDLH